MDVTETLLAKGASVTAVDGRNLSPPLACAPNEDVATCLAMILSVFLATPANSEARRSICSLSKCKIHKELWHEMQTLPNASFLIIIFNFLLQVVRPWGCQNRLSLQGCLRLVPAMELSMLIPERSTSSTLLNDLNQLRLWLIILPRLRPPPMAVYQTLSNLKCLLLLLPKLRLFLFQQLIREMSIITSVTETEQQQISKLLFRQEEIIISCWNVQCDLFVWWHLMFFSVSISKTVNKHRLLALIN